ncbi:MAG: alpha/beta hydrolase-fold protein [Patescibacteria group bacterium]|nr:alpha/beta hydrolase-fold protein [Patescibacteria group bacterium]
MLRLHANCHPIVLSVLLMTLGTPIIAADLELYETHAYPSAEGPLLYRLLKPADYSPDKKYPLVLFLHGAGERGDDNQKPLVHVAGVFTESEARVQYPCFVVVPQCPAGQLWCDTPWNVDTVAQPAHASKAMTQTMQLLGELEKQYSIDANRRYILGLSMGGFGTWDAITRYPGKFAAAVPMCGGGDVKKAAVLKDMPIWNFHGDQDGAVRVQLSRDMIAAVRDAGGQPRYTEYPGVGHNCWTPATQEPQLLPWLFSQSLNAAK